MKSYDLIVVGGGFTGVAASIAAAREGVKVLLIEQSRFLGGAATNSLVNPFMPYTMKKKTETGTVTTVLNKGIFAEILVRLDELGGLMENRRTFNEEILKLVLDRIVKENGINVLFNATLTGANVRGGLIESITVATKSGQENLYSHCFIDSTGDADLAFFAGCPYHVGREADNLCQPMTLCFRLGNVDMKKFKEIRLEISKIYQKFQAEGKIKNPRENVLIFDHVSDGVLHFNSTRIIKRNSLSSYDISIAEMEAREQVFELFSFLKENIRGFENSTLLMTAPQIGVRESRMIEGEYTITADDIISCKKFEDSIACGNYEIDIHSPDGAGTTLHYLPEDDYYTIPYRALIPKGIDNLLVAGRCISSTHEAQSAYRIMPICCSIGEGAGTSASIAIKNNIVYKNVDVNKIQELIKRYGGMC